MNEFALLAGVLGLAGLLWWLVRKVNRARSPQCTGQIPDGLPPIVASFGDLDVARRLWREFRRKVGDDEKAQKIVSAVASASAAASLEVLFSEAEAFFAGHAWGESAGEAVDLPIPVALQAPGVLDRLKAAQRRKLPDANPCEILRLVIEEWHRENRSSQTGVPPPSEYERE